MRTPDFYATIYSTLEESQTVLVYLESAGKEGVDAYIHTPLRIKPTALQTDISTAYKENGFSQRLNAIFTWEETKHWR